MTIYFYSKSDAYAGFSNFSRHGFELDSAYWPTVEHYFQAQKFAGTEYAERIREAKTPAIAKSMGRSRKVALRADWEAIKDDVMRRAVRQKFQTHQELREMLLATGDEELVENAPNDYYWGCGRNGTGRNRLGQILMEVRAALSASACVEREMPAMDRNADLEVLAEGNYLRFVRRRRWEYVTRKGSSGVVVVAALTAAGNVLFVDQFRPAVGRRMIELPAGLAGDVEGAADEPLAEAAQRELIEETGYRAAELKHVFTGPSSAGLTDEMVAQFVGTGLERVAQGGGVEGENIRVHEVPLTEVERWLEDRQREGYLIDIRVYTGLYFLRRETQR